MSLVRLTYTMLLLFVVFPKNIKVKIDVWTYATSYKFKIAKEWWGVNELRLACPSNPKKNGDDFHN